MAPATTKTFDAAPPAEAFSAHFAKRKLIDRIAGTVVRLGGISIIVSILAILVVIAVEVIPLLRSPTAEPLEPIDSAIRGPVRAMDVDEYRSVAVVVTESGLSFVSL